MTRRRTLRITSVIHKSAADLETLTAAVQFLRGLTAVAPGARPSLAFALRKLALCQADAGRHKEALAAADESIGIWRGRISARRGRYRVELVLALCVRADILDCLGRGPEAETGARQALALCRDHLAGDPRRIGPALLVALDTLARVLDAHDNPHEALPLGTELVRILRRLTARRPHYNRSLAAATHQLGVYAYDADRLTDALRATDEALRLYQRLEDDQPGAFTAHLRAATTNRDLFLTRLEQAGKVVLGPYPLCADCELVNGGLVAVRHRQRHIRVADRQACVDTALADIIIALWEHDCDTVCSCEDIDGRAGVVPVAAHLDRTAKTLADIGFRTEVADGAIFFSPHGTDGRDAPRRATEPIARGQM
ncbi:tetratricopeptide repeat protein [Nocardia sp. CDC153]|uniref:tetratricopeptide repeat protein n=1 Tax=Nocardia sp. CDC153 TaxID=3112167 RepID=UPI002DB96FEA|nr:tetratricopeptide repeat protein [Nocardia sp. CDC153]MEC3957656.1 tetratricopeptide repeat protein [Nocardia sp. CDC153]